MIGDLESGLSYFPKEIIDERDNKGPIYAYNAGILGGSDIEFFRNYSRKAFEFVDTNDTNVRNLEKINIVSVFFVTYL